jgi:hypothetical protein
MTVLRLLALLMTMTLFSNILSAQTPEDAFNKDPWPAATEGPLKVFILSGQSNMQGHAALRTLEHLIYNEETAEQYQQWKDRDGRWTSRSDVWVWTTDGERSGNLTPGFGVSDIKMGPELGFGWALGEYMDEQVLLIKTCWGGKNVKRDFLSPGSPMPSEEQLQEELTNARNKDPETTMEDIKNRYGFYYRLMLQHANEVLADLPTHFPDYNEERGYELAGLVFFQGWNDMVDGAQREENYANYTTRLAQLVRDVRTDLDAPDLPVVIGELGANGKRGAFQLAQAAVADIPEFVGNVAFTPTCEYWEPEVEELVNTNVWRSADWVRFYNVGSERGYHYLGSAKIYYSIGTAFGESMIELLE